MLGVNDNYISGIMFSNYMLINKIEWIYLSLVSDICIKYHCKKLISEGNI